jgi:hypothetical protein
MSKFVVKIKMQSLEIEVEGTQENGPRLAQRVGDQIGALLKPSLLIDAGRNGGPILEEPTHGGDKGKSNRRRSGSGGGGAKSSDDVTFTHNPAQHGSPTQEWTTTQKAIWLLWLANSDKPLSGYSIAKAFNREFKSAKAINNGNVNRGLEKERLKGAASTVGADTSDGTTRYYLTDAGKAVGAQLAKGITT